VAPATKITETPENTKTASPQAATKPAAEKEDGWALGGQVFVALQNWTRVGTSSDPKMGFGIGGTLGVGYQFSDMKFFIGPEIWYNKWSADYSQKSQSITDSVYVAMNDVGLSLVTFFDDFFLEISAGNSTLSSAMIVYGTEIPYNFDATKYTYTSVSLGMKIDFIIFGIGVKNYGGYAKYADHINLMLGLGF